MINEANNIINDYRNDMNIREIAEKYNTYPMKIRRLLIKYGEPIRSAKEEIQKSVQKGRVKSPTAGKPRTEEEKLKIGLSNTKTWQSKPENEKEEFRKYAKKRWDETPEEDKRKMLESAGKSLYRASVEGSKAEKSLKNGLTKLGYDVIMHKKDMVPNSNYELDLFIPDLMTAIEIDGPQHFKSIYGNRSLEKTVQFDNIKNGNLLARGICIIRVKYLVKNLTLTLENKLLKLVVAELEKIKKQFPEEGRRFIEVELDK